MNTFKLNVATPDGVYHDGDAVSITVKTTEGDVQILAGHADYLAALGTGTVKIVLPDASVRTAASSGGFISCVTGEVRVVATTFEYSDDIDLKRATRAKEKAEEMLSSAKDTGSVALARAKLARALTRISVAKKG